MVTLAPSSTPIVRDSAIEKKNMPYRNDNLFLPFYLPSQILKTCLSFTLLIFLVEDSPYMLGVLPSCIEVRAMEPRLLVQRLELPRARLLSPVVSKHGQVYAASTSHIWCLHLVPAHQQLAPLLEDKHFQLAIQLAVSTIKGL